MDNISSAFTKLHMPGMASCWRTLNETHQTDRLSFSDGLELLLQSELDSRRNNRIDRLIRSANAGRIPQTLSFGYQVNAFAQYSFRCQQTTAGNYI